jgi:hypothetical protein
MSHQLLQELLAAIKQLFLSINLHFSGLFSSTCIEEISLPFAHPSAMSEMKART